MSQIVELNMEGSCTPGQALVVDTWPDFKCSDLPKPEAAQTIQESYPVYTDKPMTHPAVWWAIGGIISWLMVREYRLWITRKRR